LTKKAVMKYLQGGRASRDNTLRLSKPIKL
jgi:hypothetical protein